jgi:TP901 family phage tail tape measure protein
MVRGVAAGFRAATVAAVAFGVAAGKIIKTGADFERTLVVAATRFPGEIRKGTAAFAELESAAAMAGKTTEFTATQAAQGLKLLGAAGLDVKQAIAVLPDVINLATVAEVELAEASDMAVKTLGAMGLASEDAATNQKNLKRVMDVMNQTANSASQTLGDVFEAFVIAGTEATEFNQSIETVSASIIAMARAGFVGEKAGTAYRNMMMRLTSLTPKSRKEIKRLGVALTDSAGNLRDPISLVGDLSEALDGLGTAERARRLNEIFGARAKGPFSKLIRAGTEQLREFEQAGKDAAGSLTRSAERIQDTTTGSMLQFKSAVEGVQISLFKLKDSAIKGVIDRVTEWIRTNEKLIVSKVGEWLDKIINNFDKIIDTLKKIGAIVGSLFLLVGAIKAVNAAVAAFDVIGTRES